MAEMVGLREGMAELSRSLTTGEWEKVAAQARRIREKLHHGAAAFAPTHVFAYKDMPVTRMLNSAGCRVRKKVGLPQVRVHDLKHTLGRRLRAAGVSFEDRRTCSVTVPGE